MFVIRNWYVISDAWRQWSAIMTASLWQYYSSSMYLISFYNHIMTILCIKGNMYFFLLNDSFQAPSSSRAVYLSNQGLQMSPKFPSQGNMQHTDVRKDCARIKRHSLPAKRRFLSTDGLPVLSHLILSQWPPSAYNGTHLMFVLKLFLLLTSESQTRHFPPFQNFSLSLMQLLLLTRSVKWSTL